MSLNIQSDFIVLCKTKTCVVIPDLFPNFLFNYNSLFVRDCKKTFLSDLTDDHQTRPAESKRRAGQISFL